MATDKNELKALVRSIVNEDFINAKERLESAVESTIVDHFKSILEYKETK